MCINRGIMLIEFIWVTISIIKIKNTGSLRKNASIHPDPPLSIEYKTRAKSETENGAVTRKTFYKKVKQQQNLHIKRRKKNEETKRSEIHDNKKMA